jgi:hypothetical protein
MKNFVTVIPPSRVVIVDGVSYTLSFYAPEHWHILRWRAPEGVVIFNDGRANRVFSGNEEYVNFVQSFVQMWENKHSILPPASRTPSPPAALLESQHRIEEILTLLPLIDLDKIRPAAELTMSPNSGIALNKLEALEQQAQSLRAELNQLKAEQEGFNA